MLVNWNNSFNRPSYNQYYSGYSQAFQKDNYKCKTIPSNKLDGKLEGNQGFLNAGNKTLHDWGFSALYTRIPGLVFPCERDSPKVENCMVLRCNHSGYCYRSGPFGLPKLPWWLDPFWDIFIEEPFFNYYFPPTCTPIEGIPCEEKCENTPVTDRDVFNAIKQASEQLIPGDCCRVLIIIYTIQEDLVSPPDLKLLPHLINYVRFDNGEAEITEIVRPADPGPILCKPECGYVYQINEPIKIVSEGDCDLLELCQEGGTCQTRDLRVFYLGNTFETGSHQGFEVPVTTINYFSVWDGVINNKVPDEAKNACRVTAVISTVSCKDGMRQDDVSSTIGGGSGYRPPPQYEPPRERPKEEPPECMQYCTCEEIEQLIAKYLNKSIYGHGILDSCNSRIVEWSGDGLQGISKGLEAVVSAINDLGRALCPEVRGNFSLPDCKTGTSNFDYHGKGIQGLSKQLEALAKGLRHTTGELCEARGDIMREVIGIPNKVQIQLSDDFALVVGKLNQILSKLGNDDNIFSKVVQIITLVATLLGLLNDIRALFDRQKDYTPDLESIKNMLKELERLLTPTLQGSIDAIQCDGTINSNSWGGEGLEGLNQAITALGVNMAILHSDICELLGKKLDEMKPPLLQGSVDAIRCDGSISSNSWEGEGFDGLNQAITAIGVNLAILHADLCELLDKQDEDEEELPLLEGKIDAIRCDGTIRSNSWRGKGFDGLNQAITAVGTNLAILHSDLCELQKKDTFQIVDKYKCGENEVSVQEKIENTAISRELRFLYERLKRIELLICELEECNAVPVFPGDSIEERNIPNQAVITFVESKHYPFLKGSKWHINIPYPKDDLISQTACWQKFANLTIEKGDVYGRLIWKSPKDTINRFWTAIYGKSEDKVKAFLTRVSQYSKLEVAGIRISKGANPRARPKNVTVQAVKVALLERDKEGTLQVTKCCRAPKK